MTKSILMSNSLLVAVEKKLDASLTRENREDYLKIVVSGMRAILDKGPNSILAQLKDSKDPVTDSARGAVNLVALLYKQSRGTMPYRAIPPAAMALMLHALDFADKAKILKVDKAVLVKATHIFTNYLFSSMKITPAMLHDAAGAVSNVLKNPEAVQAMKLKAGLAKAPGAEGNVPAGPEVTDGV